MGRSTNPLYHNYGTKHKSTKLFKNINILGAAEQVIWRPSDVYCICTILVNLNNYLFK